MGKGPQRHWTAKVESQIVEEDRQTGQMVSEVCRRYQITPRPFHLQKQVRKRALGALENRKTGRKPNDGMARRSCIGAKDGIKVGGRQVR